MSLIDLGKNDISDETQAFKDRLASRDTENAGLRTRLMRREAELEELRVTLNETVYKLSKEAERALQLEDEVSTRSSELKTERISLRNTEIALQSAQEKLRAEERAKKELESTLDTVSLHSQATSAENRSVQCEKYALESRVRELERIVQTHESKGVSSVPRKNGRPRSSSASNLRLPAVEQELNDVRAQLHNKDMRLRVLEQKLAEAQDNLVKAENARISIDKASQERISELLLTLEKKEEEVDLLREADNSGEREEQLLKRIDEDGAKITALEKLVDESQAVRTSQARLQKLQSQLKTEREKVRCSEDLQNRLLQEKAELLRQCEASRREVAQGRELLVVHERRIKEMEGKHAHLLTELDTHHLRKSPLSSDAEHYSSRAKRLNGITAFPNESALADHIQTLLQAIDRLRDERDGLKRALAFSEVEYRITTESYQTRIASLTRQLTRNTRDITSNAMEQKMKRLTLCATAFTVVISNLQTRLDLSKGHLSSISVDLTSSNSQLCDALAVINSQSQSSMANTHKHEVLLQKLDAVTKELAESEEERDCMRFQLADAERQVATMMERAVASEAAREEAHQSFLLAEQRFAALDKNCHDVESERNSLALQVTNLQDDLARLRNELVDTQNRYNSLHAQQLSEMAASEVVRALKDRIKELETRIAHCNDQIGDYQHDIRRLEANVKLQEERIGEMTLELEVLASQKEAMVEDCYEAREARDGAIERSEAAEEKAERIQQQSQQAKHAHDAALSAMSSTLESLTSEKQQSIERVASLEVENARLIRELDVLVGNHHRHSEGLDSAVSRSRSPEQENSEEHGGIQQAVISLAVIHCAYRDCARRLQRSYQHSISLESQLDVLIQEVEWKGTLIDNPEDVSTAFDGSQDDSFSPSGSRITTEEPSCTCAGSQQREAWLNHHDVDSLRKSLQEKGLELITARQSLEEAKSRYAEVEAGLLERIATMTMELQARAGQAENIASLRMELESVRTQLRNSMENFADLEELHNDVIQDFIGVKEVFERRLSESDEQIQKLEADHQRSLTTMETKYRHEADILTSNLEAREHDMEELHEQLRGMLEAHTHLERKLREELKAYEVSHAFANDLESDLRRTVADMHQRLVETEAETLTLQEERQLLQEQITGLQAEIHRSTSLTRYLECQVRESEDACVLLKERLQQSELMLAESEKAGKVAEFNLTLQTTQHEKVVAALRREIASLQCGPELRSALVDLEEKNREMDGLLRAKCQEIEEYDDRILETLKLNKRLTSKVESLTRRVQALQTKLSIKKQSQEPVAEATPPQKASSTSSPPIPCFVVMDAPNYPSSSHTRESSGPSLALRSKTPEPRLQPATAAPPPRTPSRTRELSGRELSAGKKRPAPDDDERDSVPAEGHYPADAYVRNGPTPRLRRAHGPGGFTPVRGASLRKPTGVSSPGRRVVAGVIPSEVITDVTNSPRGTLGQGDAQLKKRSWLGKIRGGQLASSRLGTLGGQ